jgi:hypothetical protein
MDYSDHNALYNIYKVSLTYKTHSYLLQILDQSYRNICPFAMLPFWIKNDWWRDLIWLDLFRLCRSLYMI